MKDKFGKLFEKLVCQISKNTKTDVELSSIIDEIINYFNKIMGKSFQIKHATKEEILKAGQSSFMYSLPGVIYYSPEMIRNIQAQIKNTKLKNYNPDYNDVTYAMYLINSIAHELYHCEQYLDNINGIITEQAYLNSLCFSLMDIGKIDYLDNSHEGEAYGKGVAMMRSVCQEDTLRKLGYLESYKKQWSGWNFFKKNILYHETIYYLNKIPFLNTKRGFNDIIIYANHNISILSPVEINNLIKKYPLIIIGLEEENGKYRMKKPHELMEQYFGSYIKFKGIKNYINQEEKEVLIDIYVYLLMPLLTPEIYNNLCIKYGTNKMDTFMLTLKKNINQKIILYKESYQKSIERIKQIRITDQTILQNIDEEYAKKKYQAAIIYMNEYLSKIDKLIEQQHKFGK